MGEIRELFEAILDLVAAEVLILRIVNRHEAKNLSLDCDHGANIYYFKAKCIG